MAPERWQRIRDIFSAAMDLPAAERPRFLDNACSGDLDLRRQIDAMIAADQTEHPAIGQVVEQAAVGLAAEREEVQSKADIGRRIGPYRITRLIGRGGMGAVYQAVRADDLFQKSVAIKLVSREWDSPELLARFRIERQILAAMQHPNIASLLDGGADDDGRPYIVMEHIEGEPLVDYSRRRNLSVEDRLKLFVQLCAAVQYAHRMLVIHRDIKPSNVLVTESGVLKLLDFGIAKLLAPDIAPSEQSTATMARRMTPQYASPEQLRGETLTTATDVYSLGVLLYELLVFESPYRLTGRTPLEIEKAICETGPIRLSAAVKSDPKLRRRLSGDLENIVSMALRKEPHRRYASVQQLSDDVQKHMEGFPISARVDSVFYVAGKLIQRNRLTAAAFVLVVLSIAGGWIATVRQGRRTEERYEQVRKLANSLLFDLPRSIQGIPESTPARQQLVSIGLEYLNSLSRDAGNDTSLLWELAQAYDQVGDVQGDPSGPNLGQYRPALASYRKALELLDRLMKRRRDYAVLRRDAVVRMKVGSLQERVENMDSAMASFRLSLRMAETIQPRDRSIQSVLWQVHSRISNALAMQGQSAAALESALLAAAAADMSAGQPPSAAEKIRFADARSALGDVLALTGDLNGAREAYDRSVHWLEEVLAEQHGQQRPMELMQLAYRRAGDLLGNPSFFYLGEPDQAETYHRKSLALAEQLATRDSRNARSKALHYDEMRRLAAVIRESKPAESAVLYEQSLAGVEGLLKQAPQDAGYLRALANTKQGYARALYGLRRYKAALSELDDALAIYRDLLKRDPSREVIRQDLLDNLVALGQVQTASGNYEAAEQNLVEAVGIARSLAGQAKAGLYEERCLALAEQALGDLNRALAGARRAEVVRWRAEANDHYSKALAVWSGWRSRNLAIPYSTHQEQAVLRARAALERAGEGGPRLSSRLR